MENILTELVCTLLCLNSDYGHRQVIYNLKFKQCGGEKHKIQNRTNIQTIMKHEEVCCHGGGGENMELVIQFQ